MLPLLLLLLLLLSELLSDVRLIFDDLDLENFALDDLDLADLECNSRSSTVATGRIGCSSDDDDPRRFLPDHSQIGAVHNFLLVKISWLAPDDATTERAMTIARPNSKYLRHRRRRSGQ